MPGPTKCKFLEHCGNEYTCHEEFHEIGGFSASIQRAVGGAVPSTCGIGTIALPATPVEQPPTFRGIDGEHTHTGDCGDTTLNPVTFQRWRAEDKDTALAHGRSPTGERQGPRYSGNMQTIRTGRSHAAPRNRHGTSGSPGSALPYLPPGRPRQTEPRPI